MFKRSQLAKGTDGILSQAATAAPPKQQAGRFASIMHAETERRVKYQEIRAWTGDVALTGLRDGEDECLLSLALTGRCDRGVAAMGRASICEAHNLCGQR